MTDEIVIDMETHGGSGVASKKMLMRDAGGRYIGHLDQDSCSDTDSKEGIAVQIDHRGKYLRLSLLSKIDQSLSFFLSFQRVSY